MAPDDAVSRLDDTMSRARATSLVEHFGRKPLPALLSVAMAATPLCIVSPLEVTLWGLHVSCTGCIWVKTRSSLGRETRRLYPPWRHRSRDPVGFAVVLVLPIVGMAGKGGGGCLLVTSCVVVALVWFTLGPSCPAKGGHALVDGPI